MSTVQESFKTLLEALPSEEESIQKLERTYLDNQMDAVISEIHQELVAKKLVTNNRKILRLNRGLTIGQVCLFSPSYKAGVMFSFDIKNVTFETLEAFLEKKEEFRERAIQMGEKLVKNRKLLEEALEYAKQTLLTTTNFNNKDMLSITSSPYYSDTEGIQSVNIKYGALNGFLMYDLYDMDVPTKTENFFGKVAFAAIHRKLKEKKEQHDAYAKIQRETLLTQYLEEASKRLSIPKLDKSLLRITDLDVPFNIQEKMISLYFDTSNKELVEKFESELLQLRNRVLEQEEWPFTAADIPQTIYLSPRMFFVPLNKGTMNGKEYTLYESRTSKHKAIIHVFEDGIKLTGRKRKEALQHFGYRKTAKTPVKPH